MADLRTPAGVEKLQKDGRAAGLLDARALGGGHRRGQGGHGADRRYPAGGVAPRSRLALDEAFDQGTLHEFAITFDPARPEGTTKEKQKQHFVRARELAQGERISPLVTYAECVSGPAQDKREFEALLREAAAFDVDQPRPATTGSPTCWRSAAQDTCSRTRTTSSPIEGLPEMTRFALAVMLAAGSASAQNVRIKLGTLAPQGSTWHQQMISMAEEFSKASGGKVELKIYAGGTQGNEGEMIRKMSIGQLQAASITAIGLHEITPEPQAEDAPFMIDSYEEYDYVHEKIQREARGCDLEARVPGAALGRGGLRLSLLHPAVPDAGGLREGEGVRLERGPGAEAAWKAAGFHPVVLSSTDLVPSLTSGMINIIGQSPLYAYTTHLYSRAKYMLDLHWGFLTGATVVRKDTWERIPKDVREKLLEIAEEYGKKTREDVRKQNEDAIVQMKKRGLNVVAPSAIEAWHKAADEANAVVRGKVVPAEIYDEVKKYRDEYRAQHKR